LKRARLTARVADPPTQARDGGESDVRLGGLRGQALICTTEGCHYGRIENQGPFLVFEWITKRGDTARQVFWLD
jgi:hypothetical protein